MTHQFDPAEDPPVARRAAFFARVFVPDVFVPDVFVPDVFVPDVFVPDVFVPDVFVAEAFLAAVFVAAVFLAAVFLAGVFLAGVFLAAVLTAANFFAASLVATRFDPLDPVPAGGVDSAAVALAAVLAAAVVLDVSLGVVAVVAVVADVVDDSPRAFAATGGEACAAAPAAFAAVCFAAVFLAVAGSAGLAPDVGFHAGGSEADSCSAATWDCSAVTRPVKDSSSAEVTRPIAVRARSTSSRTMLASAARLLMDVLSRSSTIAVTCSAVASPCPTSARAAAVAFCRLTSVKPLASAQ
ncbi:MAG: hypothetical protein ACR2JK_09390 [Geodermatophilaceae bacterium]